MSSREERALTYTLEAYLEGEEECDCGCNQFTNTIDYVVQCDECGNTIDIEADYEDSKN